MGFIPSLSTSVLRRELAAFHRADHVLVVSDYERSMLVDHFGFPSTKVSLAPFFYDDYFVDLTAMGIESSYEPANFLATSHWICLLIQR